MRPGSAVTIEIRHAVEDDLNAVIDIYNHYVTHTAFTFDTDTFTPSQKHAWFDAYSATGPYRLLVAADGVDIVGYATSSQFKARRAYRTSVETSIYLRPDAGGKGSGSLLYACLLQQLDVDEGLHRAYAGITLPNDASVALHEKLGFRLAGTYREVGYKFDRYWDVAWYERSLRR